MEVIFIRILIQSSYSYDKRIMDKKKVLYCDQKHFVSILIFTIKRFFHTR